MNLIISYNNKFSLLECANEKFVFRSPRFSLKEHLNFSFNFLICIYLAKTCFCIYTGTKQKQRCKSPGIKKNSNEIMAQQMTGKSFSGSSDCTLPLVRACITIPGFRPWSSIMLTEASFLDLTSWKKMLVLSDSCCYIST